MPQLEQALRYRFLFDLPLEQVVPGLCGRVQNGLWEDLAEMLSNYERRTDPKSRRAYDILFAAKERIEAISV